MQNKGATTLGERRTPLGPEVRGQRAHPGSPRGKCARGGIRHAFRRGVAKVQVATSEDGSLWHQSSP